LVRLNPTLDVVVAWPLIARPASVVVPKPVFETLRSVVDAEFATSKRFVSVVEPNTVRRA
jgi:hypothetical protein